MSILHILVSAKHSLTSLCQPFYTFGVSPARVCALISRLAPIGRLSAAGMGSGTVLAITWFMAWFTCGQQQWQQRQQREVDGRASATTYLQTQDRAQDCDVATQYYGTAIWSQKLGRLSCLSAGTTTTGLAQYLLASALSSGYRQA